MPRRDDHLSCGPQSPEARRNGACQRRCSAPVLSAGAQRRCSIRRVRDRCAQRAKRRNDDGDGGGGGGGTNACTSNTPPISRTWAAETMTSRTTREVPWTMTVAPSRMNGDPSSAILARLRLLT